MKKYIIRFFIIAFALVVIWGIYSSLGGNRSDELIAQSETQAEVEPQESRAPTVPSEPVTQVSSSVKEMIGVGLSGLPVIGENTPPENPIKLSGWLLEFAREHYGKATGLEYIVFHDFPEVRASLISAAAEKKAMLYEIVYPNGTPYALPDEYTGKLFMIFEDPLSAGKFVTENGSGLMVRAWSK